MHIDHYSILPSVFCWTRFGPEAGESFDEILARKNAEREACGGIFYWGIGSAVGPAVAALLAEVEQPEVLFSPIKSSPRAVDVSPAQVVRWLTGKGLFGEVVRLPDAACVTSRWDPCRPGAPRYALVCATDQPLRWEDHGELSFPSLRNLCSGSPVGASQVTAVVRRDGDGGDNAARPLGRRYAIALRVSLVWPYVVRLSSPTPVARPGRREARGLVSLTQT